eukprot:1655631-Pleurochrysis_carterae.AAC.1
MIASSTKRTRLARTGFTKVTVALNNPTPLHVDKNNVGVTGLVAFDVSTATEPLVGGSHIVVSDDLKTAL